ncbi:tRNA (guanine(37)-N(1))-methyltransferase [hydrothermal vent metagenome]|uniref:tRNA (guanine-N(1)-)-methyltransferase n=1 Tax=hydrothermal vent metagenome TaxID=652676 RepID=A0A3B0YYM3_9ZZZZ
MRFDVLSLFPDMFRALSEEGVVGRALDRGLIDLKVWNPRSFTNDPHRTVDDRPYGGGPGMVMKPEPLIAAIQAAKQSDSGEVRIVYMSPQGACLNHEKIKEFSKVSQLIVVAGRYEGIDERVIQAEVDEECSIGDYVLSGGELAAMVVIDAVARLIPGVLGHKESAMQDSFSSGLLDCPHYTRPASSQWGDVPPVLLSGDHVAIARWRSKQALARTWRRRPELLSKMELTAEQQALLDEFKKQN